MTKRTLIVIHMNWFRSNSERNSEKVRNMSITREFSNPMNKRELSE